MYNSNRIKKSIISKSDKENERRLKLPLSGLKRDITIYPADIKRTIKGMLQTTLKISQHGEMG